MGTSLFPPQPCHTVFRSLCPFYPTLFCRRQTRAPFVPRAARGTALTRQGRAVSPAALRVFVCLATCGWFEALAFIEFET